MIALWMLYTTVIGVLLAAAAHALEPLVAARGWPRRWVWVAVILALPLVPIVASHLRLSPSTGTPALAAARAVSVELMPPAVAYSSRFDEPLTALWIGSTVLLLGGYLGATIVLAYRRRRWRATQVDGHRVYIAPDTGPAVVGTFRPSIVLPTWALALEGPNRALIIAHESEHLRTRDPLLLQFAVVITCFLPWNPALWWILHRLQLAIEVDCDARVLRTGCDARRYTNLLLTVGARRRFLGPVIIPAFVERMSPLSRRITAMYPVCLKFQRLRVTLSGVAAAILVAIACSLPVPAVAQMADSSVTVELTSAQPDSVTKSDSVAKPGEFRGKGTVQSGMFPFRIQIGGTRINLGGSTNSAPSPAPAPAQPDSAQAGMSVTTATDSVPSPAPAPARPDSAGLSLSIPGSLTLTIPGSASLTMTAAPKQ